MCLSYNFNSTSRGRTLRNFYIQFISDCGWDSLSRGKRTFWRQYHDGIPLPGHVIWPNRHDMCSPVIHAQVRRFFRISSNIRTMKMQHRRHGPSRPVGEDVGGDTDQSSKSKPPHSRLQSLTDSTLVQIIAVVVVLAALAYFDVFNLRGQTVHPTDGECWWCFDSFFV